MRERAKSGIGNLVKMNRTGGGRLGRLQKLFPKKKKPPERKGVGTSASPTGTRGELRFG